MPKHFLVLHLHLVVVFLVDMVVHHHHQLLLDMDNNHQVYLLLLHHLQCHKWATHLECLLHLVVSSKYHFISNCFI